MLLYVAVVALLQKIKQALPCQRGSSIIEKRIKNSCKDLGQNGRRRKELGQNGRRRTYKMGVDARFSRKRGPPLQIRLAHYAGSRISRANPDSCFNLLPYSFAFYIRGHLISCGMYNMWKASIQNANFWVGCRAARASSDL